MQKIIPGLIAGIILVLVISLLLKIFSRIFKSKRKPKISKPQRVRRFKCLDKHWVRSKGELIIDNYFTILGIEHIYEKILIVKGKKVKSDWFLPDFEVYIEYWGLSGKKYNKRKKEKLKLYELAHKKVLSIENYMFVDIYSKLDEFLKKIGKSKKIEKILIQKFCNYCGMELDNRFQLF